MDIGEQKRVIIVEPAPLQVPVEDPGPVEPVRPPDREQPEPEKVPVRP
jgi:hypothetical protein